MNILAKGLVVSLWLALVPPAFAGDEAKSDMMKPSKAMQAVMDDDTKGFFETAASANQFEIEASRIASQQATDPALKEFAAKMIKDHSQAGAELQALARKKNTTTDTALLRRHEAMLKDLKNEKPGKAFDDEYRDKMITSHKEAVSLFDEQARDGKDPDVKAFAAKLLPKLQAHGGAAQHLPKPGEQKQSRR
jgi:putative membrane protein